MSSKIFYKFCQIFADYWFWDHFLPISLNIFYFRKIIVQLYTICKYKV